MRNIFASKTFFMAVAITVSVFASTAWAQSARSDKAAPGNAGGASSEHKSEKGAANTNGRDAADRATGQSRAEERRSEQGADHNKAGDHQHDEKEKGAKKDRPAREKKH
jgi:hypothetical protein